MRMWALVTDSLREIYARKVIIGIVIIELVTLGITSLILFSDAMQRDYSDARLAVGGLQEVQQQQEDASEEAASFNADDSLLLGFDSMATDAIATDSTNGRDTTTSRSLDAESPAGPARGTSSGELVLVEKVSGELGLFSMPVVLATLFLGIFATAGIVPSMMEKGTIDLLLSKPLPRWKLLWGRALGGVVAVGANLLLFTVAIWALYGSASGVWYAPFIGMTCLFAFTTFLVVFTGIVALNVTTESWVLPMSLAYIHLMILSNFLTAREETIFQWVHAPALQALITGLYYILPQTNDLIVQSGTAVHTGTILDWGPFLQGAIFATIMVALATWRFQQKDF
jgi:ABC-type transport system involved in multi-copper enzyme maturation permease subunit